MPSRPMSASVLGETRASGVLLHPTSLPGRGTGDLGETAYRFVDWLAEAGQSYWQVLPLAAITEVGSPYNSLSALAGNPWLLSLERLVADGLLDASAVEAMPVSNEDIDFPELAGWKGQLLAQVHAAFRRGAAPELREPFQHFQAEHAFWLEDYALFQALREHDHGAPWTAWDAGVRERHPDALRRARQQLAEAVENYAFQQFLFARQWCALRRYANQRGIRMIGDLPIFVDHNSADVWAHQEFFQLDERGEPQVVSGVPPDYFNALGQHWGHPLYRWEVMAARGYPWWTERLRTLFEAVDLVRMDHFRGFEAYWAIPATETTALHGHWVAGPGERFFRAMERVYGPLPVIAEDLGLITPAVDALREAFGFPGMRVLQFAFDGDPANPHLPENHPQNAVAYTGTHDNPTAMGWWETAVETEHRLLTQRADPTETGVHWQMMRMAFASPARLAIVPLQDVLGLGREARMNTPGVRDGNWAWRFAEEALTPQVQAHLREVTCWSTRLPAGAVSS
jgi:4-alpha-glucanotransferase